MSAPHGGGSGRDQFPGLPSLCTRHRAGAERINPTCYCLPPVCERVSGPRQTRVAARTAGEGSYV